MKDEHIIVVGRPLGDKEFHNEKYFQSGKFVKYSTNVKHFDTEQDLGLALILRNEEDRTMEASLSHLSDERYEPGSIFTMVRICLNIWAGVHISL